MISWQMASKGLDLYNQNWRRRGQIVTVFMMTYRRPKYLSEAICSVLAQTYKNFYLIVLDNLSKDETEEVVNNVADDRVIYLEHNGELTGSNFIYAFDIVKTQYLVVLHDDDILMPTYLEEVLGQITNNEGIAALSVVNNTIDGEGKLMREGSQFEGIKRFLGDDYFVSYFVRQVQKQSMIYPATIYNRALIGDIKKFTNKSAGPCADQFMWFEMGRQGLIIGIFGASLFNYRVHENQDSVINAGAMRLVLLRFLLNIDHYNKILVANSDCLGAHIKNAFFAALLNYSSRLYKYKDFKRVYQLIPQEMHSMKACKFWIFMYRMSLVFPHVVLLAFKISGKGKRIGKR